MSSPKKTLRKNAPAKRRQRLIAAAGSGLIALAAIVLWSALHRSSVSAAVPRKAEAAASLKGFLALPISELSNEDIARANLLCAEGLPGAEDLDAEACLATLGQWAEHVRAETERNMHRFRQNPAEYDHSEGYFRMLMMAVVVYEDFGIRYNPARMSIPGAPDKNDTFFADSHDLFLHGLCGSRRMGTCSSMPVLYVAIGRRLGYPLKLATTKAHLFLRWKDGKEMFDLEATGKGMDRYDDDHFRNWPYPVTQEEEQREGYLRSLNPAEELALFLSLRGHCLSAAARPGDAAACYAEASRLAPGTPAYRLLLADAQTRTMPSGSLHSARPRTGPVLSWLPPASVNLRMQPGVPSEPNPIRNLR